MKKQVIYLETVSGILTIWKEYGNETFSEMELLSR